MRSGGVCDEVCVMRCGGVCDESGGVCDEWWCV